MSASVAPPRLVLLVPRWLCHQVAAPASPHAPAPPARSTIDLCNKLGITFLGYSPLGVPDWHSFPNKGKYNGTVMSPNQLEDPAAIEVAQYLGITPAQALLAWQWQAGIPVNPRSQNKQHMVQNLEAYKYKLSTTQMDTLSHRPQAWCSVDPKFYECAPDKPTVQ